MGFFQDHAVVAQVLTCAGGIAKRNTSDVDISHGVGSHELEQLEAGHTECLEDSVAGAGSLKQIKDEITQSKEPCHEGTSNNTAKVLKNEGLEGSDAAPVLPEVVGDSIASHTVIA